MKVAVVGAGVSGLVVAYTLARAGVHVVLYEKEDYIGGQPRTICADGIDVDLGFMVCNRVTYPNTTAFFEELGVEFELSDMSFSVSLDDGKGCEWSSSNGLSGLFAQKRNALSPFFWRMVRELAKFKKDVLEYLEILESNDNMDVSETLEHFIESHGYSNQFRDYYLVPICASIWSCSPENVMKFSATLVLSFFHKHHLLQLYGRPQWLTIKGHSHAYVNKVIENLDRRGCIIRTSCRVCCISTIEEGVCVMDANGSKEIYDQCIMAVHAPDALDLIRTNATFDENKILSAFQYVSSDIYMHRDIEFMPKNPAAWSAWNFLGSKGNHVCVTYWLNMLQNLGDTGLPFLVTVNPPHPPQHTFTIWSTSYTVPSPAAAHASKELDVIQGKRRIWFCGAYQGYGFHEDGLKAGRKVAHDILGESCNILEDIKQMVPSWFETGARLITTNFLQRYICTGHLTLLEDGGTIFKFEGKDKSCIQISVLRIHQPSFYWKIATRADLGLADAYIDGDFSFVDGAEGLLNLFLILIANGELCRSVMKKSHGRGWWTPMFFTTGFSSVASFLQHFLRKNSLTQARRNISSHYDLSNDMFSLFLDDSMTYSCAIFKDPEEPLKHAQLRKLHLLIDKAQIDSNHEVLDIGCGWGSLALEAVKKTGCRYTGITLSKEQLKFAQKKVKEACLEDRITLLLCDYRELLGFHKYNRIISCGMVEHVGHEYIEEYFSRCEYLLAEDGLLVLQFTSVPDERYDEYRKGTGFVKEYIFQGGCLLSLNRVLSAMAAASTLWVEHVENIGIHYYHTLRHWRKNFHANRSEILKLGFSEQFMRMWEYYLVYCAAGFKTRTLANYQVYMWHITHGLFSAIELLKQGFSHLNASANMGCGGRWSSLALAMSPYSAIPTAP